MTREVLFMKDGRFSFASDGQNSTLVYKAQPDESFWRFDKGMLTNNVITGILVYAVEFRGGEAFLTFNIAKGTRLSLLKNKGLNGQNVFSILLGIADVLISSEQFMLKENQFVFDEDCIFVNTNNFSVNMVYIPTNKYSGITFSQFVKEFIINGSFDYGNEAAVFMSVLKYLNTNLNASAWDIKAIINKGIQTPVQVQHQPMDQGRSGGSVQQTPPMQSPPQPDQQTPFPPVPSKDAEPPKKFWKFFGGGKAKNEPAAGGVIGNMNIPGMSPQKSPSAPGPVYQNSAKAKPFGKAQQQADPVSAQQCPPSIAAPPEIILDEGPETILIKKYKTPAVGRGTPYLVAKNGERVRITRSGFTVGRENTSGINNDYTIKSPSVGRNHAMFEIKNGKYYVIDMTSLNGTFVNGTQIAGNIETEIRSGDVIAFAESEFRFVVE